MNTIEHQHQGEELIVWTYPASGARYTYTFETNPPELQQKTKTTDAATSEEQKTTVAPTLTPAVRDYLMDNGYDI